MKLKIMWFVMFMLFTTNAQAEMTSWIKGGATILRDQQGCAFDIPGNEFCLDSSQIKSNHNYFFQISPVNFRNKIWNGVGFRLEPWVGYSEAKTSFDLTEGARFSDTVLDQFSAKVKNFQLGLNLFADYSITKDLEIYGGPVIGVEWSAIFDGKKVESYSNHTHVDAIYSGMSSNFLWGLEAGLELKAFENVSINAFGSLFKHKDNKYSGLVIDGHDADLELTSNVGNEVRIGAGLTYYWN